jgi:hypothetical protein
MSLRAQQSPHMHIEREEIINAVSVFNGINELPAIGCLRRSFSQ